ncbi:MAG: glycoside hydrolase family 2 protein [Lentisphaerae bacterium]|jgi:beta-galactosidase|nr:glycoside hydrolase family 2 protein [Lentisphaerota bacterium]
MTTLFNFDWKFHYDNPPPGAHLPDFDHSSWRTIDLPHDFQMEQPWNKNASAARAYKAMGTGWYRKEFKTDPSWQGCRVFIDFEGVMLHGTVWCNGTKVADIDFGYLGTFIDLTPYLHWNRKNIIAVRSSTGKAYASRWYTGGGIFRDVNLIIKNQVSIAHDGIFITTPSISKKEAKVSVQVELEGISEKKLDVEICAKLRDPEGKLVAECRIDAPKDIRLKTVETPLPLMRVSSPKLWSCETPNLYTAEIKILHDGKIVDEASETFGIRTVEFSKEFGFKLNGKKVFLKGISNHHDLGALGAAVHDRAIERLFLKLKKFGFNHVRTSHNPYSKSFLRLADKHGILIVDELVDKWCESNYWPGAKPFREIWDKIVPSWIKRDRNHPSVILWSLGNELQMQERLAGFDTGDWGITTYKILDILVKRYDPTRKTTVAMFPSRANAITRHDPEFNTFLVPPELSLVTEVASFNYQYKCYQAYLEHAPDLIIYQSEAASADMSGAFFGMDYDKMIGIAYWGAVEYWGESSGWPRKGWVYSFFNRALEAYPQAWLLRSAFCKEPIVRIGVVDSADEKLEWNDIIIGRTPVSSHWNREKDSLQKVFVYSNAEEVELFVNGNSLGVKRNNFSDPEKRNIFFWEKVPYGEGGSIMAVARSNEKETAHHKLETTGPAVKLRLEAETPDDWKADGMDLQYVTVRTADSEGRLVPLEDVNAVFEVTGAASLRAVDNGDASIDSLFNTPNIPFHNGFAMAILRSEKKAGNVKLKVSADGIADAELSLKTCEP